MPTISFQLKLYSQREHLDTQSKVVHVKVRRMSLDRQSKVLHVHNCDAAPHLSWVPSHTEGDAETE